MDEIPRPVVGLDWYLAHGLGNDYLVARGESAWGPFDERERWEATPEAVRTALRRTTGVGADGIVVITTRDEPFALRGFNPDGSEFERSGNGLRIVASFLHRIGWVEASPFKVLIAGDLVEMHVHAADADLGLYDVSVEMGRAVVGDTAVALDRSKLTTEIAALDFTPVSVGNPHAVVWTPEADVEIEGRIMASSPAWASSTNVQLARVTAPDELWIEIWERGVGRTSASGSSACASAVAAVETGRLQPGDIRVRMAGGSLGVSVSPDLDVVLRGPVQAVAEGRLDPGFARALRS